MPSATISYPAYPSHTQDPVAQPKRVVIGRTAALQLRLRPFLYTCKQESGSTQLGVPTRGRFHNKPRHCPRTLPPTRRPPKTPLLHHNESSSAAQQRYGSVFVIAGGCGSAAERLAHAKANAPAPPAAVEVPPSAEFTFVASREPTPLPLRPRWFAHTLMYLSKSDWPDHAWKSSSLARRMRLLSTLGLSLSRVRPTS